MFESIAFSWMKAIVYLKSAHDKSCKASHYSVLTEKNFTQSLYFMALNKIKMNCRDPSISNNINPQNISSDRQPQGYAKCRLANIGYSLLSPMSWWRLFMSEDGYSVTWGKNQLNTSIVLLVSPLLHFVIKRKTPSVCLSWVATSWVLMWCHSGRWHLEPDRTGKCQPFLLTLAQLFTCSET